MSIYATIMIVENTIILMMVDQLAIITVNNCLALVYTYHLTCTVLV